MKTILILGLSIFVTGCAYDPVRAQAAYERARNCSTVTYSKYNGRIGMSTVCRRGNDVSIIRNM